MADSLFFDNYGPFSIEEIIKISHTKLANKNIDISIEIDGVAPLLAASENHLSFFSNSKYLEEFKKSRAGVCITSEKFAGIAPKDMVVLISDNPYKAYAMVASSFHPFTQVLKEHIPASVYLADSATIGKNCEFGQNVVIESGVIIGNNCKISHNSVICKNVIIGDHCHIAANVVISHAIIQNYTIIHPGVKIGQDGFGFASDATGHLKVPQLGRVLIGNYVEIGANTTIDRGAGPDTIIGDMTKIDNLVQIGHNVKIGKGCLLVAQVGVAGSTLIEDFVALGGQVGVAGHLTIGALAQVAAQGGVTSDIAPKQVVGGTPAVPIKDWHRQSIMLKKLIRKKQE